MYAILEDSISKSQYASLLHDFVESEFFVIDGDSLMVEYIDDITFCDGQNLYFFYLIECCLMELQQKGAKFVIVFFQDAEHLWSNDPYLYSLRVALVLHLQHNTKISVYSEFSSFLSCEWKMFLKEHYPYFIMISDQGLQKEEKGSRLFEEYFNMFISHTLGSGINVALTSGDIWDTLRVYGYHVQSSFYMRQIIKRNEEKINILYKKLLQRLSSLSCADFALLATAEKEVGYAFLMLKSLWPEGSDVRRVVCVVTCSAILRWYNRILTTEASLDVVKEESDPKCQKNEGPLSLEEVADVCRMYCLCEVFLFSLSLSSRAKMKTVSGEWNKQLDVQLQIRRFFEYVTLKTLGSMEGLWQVDLKYLPDLSDEVLLTNIALHCEKESCTDIELGEEIAKEYRQLWDIISRLAHECKIGDAFPVRRTSRCLVQPDEPKKDECKQKITSIGLIKVKSRLVERYAGDVLKDLPVLSSDDPVFKAITKLKDYDELHHWHSGKPLSDDYQRTRDLFETENNSKDINVFLKKRRYLFHVKLWGESLEGNITKQITTTKGNAMSSSRSAREMNQSKQQPKTRGEMITEEHMRKVKAELEQAELRKWERISARFSKEIIMNLSSGIRTLESFIKNCPSESVKLSAEMLGLETCFELWVELCSKTENSDLEETDSTTPSSSQTETKKSAKKKEKAQTKTEKSAKKKKKNKERKMNTAIEIMRRVHAVISNYQEQLTKKQKKKIARLLAFLGFNNLAIPLSKLSEKKGDNEDCSDSMYAIGMGAARFQLQYMGHYLQRDERKDPDPRVQHFIPDTWQRELLDAVDNNESAVIVAPTSSGKTYASYYCMEKVLRESDDGVLVYVAPTKALVNQVMATVYNRFQKNMPDGMEICGIFTRDYRFDALNCQVLVTVPQCLEILLLSPHRQEWVKKIRYIIFDEVHCLGGEIGAEVWEHLLVMIRCPFLALSATISNPEDLTEWLNVVRRYWREEELSMESSFASRARKKRKSYRVILVTFSERYNDLEKSICTPGSNDFDFSYYHPCAALTVKHIKEHGLPSDLSLSPKECVMLYDSMSSVWKTWPRANELDPEEFSYFKNKIVIRRTDARQYEEELKKELVNWITQDHEDEVGAVLKALKPDIKDITTQEYDDMFPRFVEELHKMDKLPAIFFQFNINRVERFAENTWLHLKTKELRRKFVNGEKESSQYANTLQLPMDYETFKTIFIRQQNENPLVSEAKNNNLMKQLEELEKILPDCTYANTRSVEKKILQYICETANINWLLMRGIGCHHASMNLKDRRVVEMLFRRGFVKVVTATGSLALGINMPCKSVVFVDDSLYLDAINYRQMSGRAGRRGQDLIGSVYFYNIPQPKIERLIRANVPKLKGQFPLSITLILRLMLLGAKADDIADAEAKSLSVLKHSLLTFNQPKKIDMLKKYFLFSLQFLVGEGYLDQNGIPQGFAGLVSHLHYHEPSNFMFVNFLVKGLFHKICKPIPSWKTGDRKRFSENVMTDLVLVLANLFGRKVFRLKDKKILGPFEQSTLLIILFAVILKRKFAFSGVEHWESSFASHLMASNKEIEAISPFAALSGNTNNDLLDSCKTDSIILHTIGFHMHNIPWFQMKMTDHQGRKMPYNAYALDFYKHGSLDAITDDNEINRGEAYNLLRDFSLTISAISVSLCELCENEYDDVVLAFEQLSRSYREKFASIPY
ncbi:probable ATP-dependent RNA helicase DDX60 [Protopterus annectens]|uniref:probable ATP-dependent RNA helicase DDX60 n=1 Tax=Protopterus annectens TaxID=7888 RepID=UPI001CF9D6B2|nr:probable ATP-dependent RNA helicase DDX60 [Protopterus annectens]